MQLKKLMIEVMVFFVLGCFLCACGKTKDQTRKTTKDANKEIMIGGDNYPPFNYTDENGNMAGIDVEFAREAFHRMGYKPVFVNIDWENKKNLVEQGKIDCIWACFSVTGRENDYHWAGPYMLSRQVIAVNDSSKINKLSDLKNKIIAVQSTTKPEELFLKQTDSKIPKVKQVYSMENRELIYTSLSRGDLPKEEQMKNSIGDISFYGGYAGTVKLADRITNLQEPPNHWTQEKIKAYWVEAKYIHEELKHHNKYLAQRLEFKIKEYERAIRN